MSATNAARLAVDLRRRRLELLARAARDRHPRALARQRRRDRRARSPGWRPSPARPVPSIPRSTTVNAIGADGPGDQVRSRRAAFAAEARRARPALEGPRGGRDRDLRRPRRPPRPTCEGHLVRGHVHGDRRRPAASPAPPTSGRARAGADPLLERQRQPRLERRRAARRAGMAVKLRPPDADETDILATTAPRLLDPHARGLPRAPARSGNPIPRPGQPDMEKLGAWLGEHPEAQPSIPSTLGIEPPASFATRPLLLPAHASSSSTPTATGPGSAIAGGPRPATRSGSPTTTRARSGRDYLFDELASASATARFASSSCSSFAAEGDPIDDPTAVWPDDSRARRRGHARDHRRRRRPRGRRPHRRLRPAPPRRRNRAFGRPRPSRTSHGVFGLRLPAPG